MDALASPPSAAVDEHEHEAGDECEQDAGVVEEVVVNRLWQGPEQSEVGNTPADHNLQRTHQW